MPATSELHTDELRREVAVTKEEKPEKKEKKFVALCDERGYVDLVEHIMHNGTMKGDRTGTGIISVFGAQVRYSLRGKEFSFFFR